MQDYQVKEKMLKLLKYLSNTHRLLILLFAILFLIVIVKEFNKANPKTQEQIKKYRHVSTFVARFYENSKWNVVKEEEIEEGIFLEIKISYFGTSLSRKFTLSPIDSSIIKIHRIYNDDDPYYNIYGLPRFN